MKCKMSESPTKLIKNIIIIIFNLLCGRGFEGGAGIRPYPHPLGTNSQLSKLLTIHYSQCSNEQSDNIWRLNALTDFQILSIHSPWDVKEILLTQIQTQCQQNWPFKPPRCINTVLHFSWINLFPGRLRFWIDHFNGAVLIITIGLYFFSLATHLKSSSSTTSRESRWQFAACSGWRWRW